MTEHPYDIHTLRRELHLERISKYIKKNIKIINTNPGDVNTVINLLKTKERLLMKMNNHIQLYNDYGVVDDKLLALLINNILSYYEELNGDIVKIIMETVFYKHIKKELDDDYYGSSYNSGYDSY